MKKKLLLVLLVITSMSAISQTWTGLGANTNWNNTDNWDNNTVPTTTDNVIIPTGFTVFLNVPANVLSIDVQGNAEFQIQSNLTFSEASTFGTNTIITWNSGAVNGASSTLTNHGTINLATNAGHSITGGTTLTNLGTINITSAGDLFLIGSETVLNNAEEGVIDLQADAGNITWSGTSGVINNSGLIKRTTSTGEVQIIATLNNNDGTIQVEEGVLSFQSVDKNFTDGTYNVFSGATMDWDTTINPVGTLSGAIAGTLNLNSTINVAEGTTASFSFSEDASFNWVSGTLTGGGTLNNNNELNLTSNAGHSLTAGTSLNNSGTINITSAGDLFLNGSGTVLNNAVAGVIDLQTDAGNITWSGTSGVINNSGMIKRTTSTGEVQIIATLNNNDGTIQVEEGILSFQSVDKNFTDGTYNVFSGATMDWDTTINPVGTLSGAIAGTLNWNSTVNVAEDSITSFSFSEGGNFNWVSGTLTGGGTLNNNSELNLTGTASHSINGDTSLNNLGTINITSAGDLFLVGSGTALNNDEEGVIDLQADAGNITWSGTSGVINNSGMIKRTTSTGEVQIVATLNNNDGTIQVEEGILSFQSVDKNFTDGTYNVFSGATMDWDTTINPVGTLGGDIAGNLNWNSTVNVAEGTTASFSFSEEANFNWVSGTLTGGGTLNNNSELNLTGTASHSISGDTTLNNLDIINITSGGDLFLVGSGTVLNNDEEGIIDLQADAGNITWSGTSGVINNTGLLKRTTTSGLVQIFVVLNNTGTIEVASGELEITGSQPFINEETGIVSGIGIFDLPTVTNYTNNGIFAPGLSPGTLSVQGDYVSTASSILDVELNGLVPDSEYDVLAITGNNNVFEGSVNIAMGFEGTIGDQFDIATTTGTITTANLQSPIGNVDFDGFRYTFDVSYPDDNKVRLSIVDKVDILPPNIIVQDIMVQLDETGNITIADNAVDNGTTDNHTPTEELQFSLDITDFTCANLGDNLVALTVTDNAGNSDVAQATVTVIDNTSPSVITKTITVELGNSGSASITPEQIDNGSSDNCSVVSLSLDKSDFTCADIGINTVNLTVTDQSGNFSFASATIEVQDNQVPVITCPSDFTVESAGDYILPDYFANNTVITSDNCAVAVQNQTPVAGTALSEGAHTVSFEVLDGEGNTNSCSFVLTVDDTTLTIEDLEFSENDIILFPNPIVEVL